ncbi:cytoplasmic dynein 1 intermediate chain 2 isoform X13 [Patella vulgata]|uniref:cytoplasmic dynein 1 intermediate chain 2 isoform X13 n=1 Tax=Patella vulgata TaxID=6465 RepID=UPI00217F563E|nr:cytoplasmic dynein 1 intermediate chain 2 isoform X13 [Patella vulgata]
MADRKAELERKKARLEQMRRERQEKVRQKASPAEGGDDTKSKPQKDLRSETDDLLRNLGIPEASTVQTVVTKSPSGGEEVVHTVKTSSRSKVKLSLCKVNETSIAPREQVSYSKETQTLNTEPVDKDVLVYDDPQRSDDEADTDSMDQGVDSMPSGMPQVKMVDPAKTAEDLVKKEEPPVVRELTEEEKELVLNDPEFNTFLTKTSRIMERALAENYDILIDYSGGDGENKEDDLLAGERLKLNRTFYDERWSRHRTVTSLDWSIQHPELLVASYNVNEDAPHDPDGIALIWNNKFKKTTPEYVFHCQSALMSTCFAKFHPNLVVGGTYSGQIVLWDNRVNKRTPIQRTPLSAAAHTHPVYCVNVVGTQNAHNLISVSTDGKMCSWSLDMLSQPQDSMELQHKQSKAVAVTSFCFLSGDVNNFVVGAEDCTVYTACRHGSKAGINEAFDGHQGPITAIDAHSVPGQIDFSPYFLTSSFDWTIKLWSIKDQKYIHSFEDNSDYVYGVEWSPIHPALFASVDGNGRLDLWHLNNETEVPTASTVIDGNVALNTCRWHQSGHHISVGDDMGKIHIYDVGEHLANPKSGEWSKFVHTIQELKQHAAEREDDSNLALR